MVQYQSGIYDPSIDHPLVSLPPSIEHFLVSMTPPYRTPLGIYEKGYESMTRPHQRGSGFYNPLLKGYGFIYPLIRRGVDLMTQVPPLISANRG